MAEHVAVDQPALQAARDEAKEKICVLLTTRCIIATLRNGKFFSVAELHEVISVCLIMQAYAPEELRRSQRQIRPAPESLPILSDRRGF